MKTPRGFLYFFPAPVPVRPLAPTAFGRAARRSAAVLMVMLGACWMEAPAATAAPGVAGEAGQAEPAAAVAAAPAPAGVASVESAGGGTNASDAGRVNRELSRDMTREMTREMMEALHKEIEVQVAKHTGAITSTLMQIEPALNRIRQQQAETAASANRTILIAAGLFAVAGFFGLGFLTMASVRAMGRFTEVAVNAAGRRQLPGPGETAGPAVAPAESGAFKPAVSSTVEQASARFQGALEQLEKRILELEHTSHVGGAGGSVGTSGSTGVLGTSGRPEVPFGNGSPAALVDAASASSVSTPASRAGMHLGKGQALLNLDQAAEALECFNQALAEDPDNTDALLRKGMALEKLEEWERALECYDRVILLDRSLTVAYLYKGGICNRLERHREALESYEQALRSERQRVGT